MKYFGSIFIYFATYLTELLIQDILIEDDENKKSLYFKSIIFFEKIVSFSMFKGEKVAKMIRRYFII